MSHLKLENSTYWNSKDFRIEMPQPKSLPREAERIESFSFSRKKLFVRKQKCFRKCTSNEYQFDSII
jgi:hypothetical protein